VDEQRIMLALPPARREHIVKSEELIARGEEEGAPARVHAYSILRSNVRSNSAGCRALSARGRKASPLGTSTASGWRLLHPATPGSNGKGNRECFSPALRGVDRFCHRDILMP